MLMLLALGAAAATVLVVSLVLHALAGDVEGRVHPLTALRATLVERRAERVGRLATARLLPRPDCDRPPAGLPPLVASPRVVAAEAARGIRELQVWLADQAAA